MKQKISVSLLFFFLILSFFSCQKSITDKTSTERMSANYSSTAEADGLAAPNCGEILRTQTPGGWGAPASGNNPGAYLHANFAAAFPNGLTIGCEPSYFVKFTSAQAITDFMPAGGKPRPLTDNFIDPFSTDLKNTLVDHVAALSLSIGFDLYDPNFGPSGFNLGFMVVTSGKFTSKNVNDILAEANRILGGCGSSYSVADMVQVLDQINNNYVDGNTNNGFLTCPENRIIDPER
jgi:hypothetical protein